MAAWTVCLRRRGRPDVNTTVDVPYLSPSLIVPQLHAGIPWFTKAVFDLVSVDDVAKTAVAEFSHLEKTKLDRPRDPARIPA